ncbi:MAG: MFS transporter [Dehalococcoidia bacterium]|nr:MFS transporter [Dehalococcoidia bacterium]
MTNQTDKNIKKKPKLFYGWIIVGVLAIVNGVTMAMGTVNFGLFPKPMGDEISAGRSMFGWAQTARQITGAVTSPLIGKLLDRYGSRILLPVAAVVTSASMVAMGFVNSGWQMILIFGVMGTVGIGGPATLLTAVPVAKWFVRLRGRALGLTSLGSPLGAMALVPLTQVLITGFGWRETWMVLGVMALVLVCPLSFLLLKRQPEDIGLRPDGVTDAVLAGGNSSSGMPAPEESWTLEEARKTGTFWRLIVVFSIATLGTSTLGLHRLANFIDHGLDAQLVANAISVEAGTGALSVLTMGFLFERVQAKYLGAVSFIFLAGSAYFSIIGDSVFALFGSMVTFGVGIGGNMLLQNYLWPNYYGRKHLGAIRGTVMPATLLFASIGPPLAGYVYDSTGTYNVVWWVGIGLIISGAIILATTHKPHSRAAAPII